MTNIDCHFAINTDNVLFYIIIVISPCTRSPCQNNGVCNIIDRKVTCKCPGDWFGDVCQYGNYIYIVFNVVE